MIHRYVKRMSDLEVEDLIGLAYSQLDGIVEAKSDSKQLARVEAAIQVLQTRKLDKKADSTLNKIKDLLSQRDEVKCRCTGYNSYEVVGFPASILEGKYSAEDETSDDLPRLHSY